MEPKKLISIDPSLTNSGFAEFHDGFLKYTWSQPANKKISWQDRLIECHDRLSRRGGFYRTDTVAFELPKVYTQTRGMGDPSGLIKISVLAGVMLGVIRPTHILTYEPGQWVQGTQKSTTKKGAAISSRALRLKDRLSEAEAALVDWSDHDQIDAVCIGLHALGRWGRLRAYHKEAK